tara:strand:+ start:1013 stop:1324 length:312 start_codon:yes stop_codon:yes gene_type:complete
MKSSIHLFYGIIIGVLICACTGSNSDNESATPTNTATPTSIKSDKAEFKEEKLVRLGRETSSSYNYDMASKEMARLKSEGWTILDVEIVSMEDRSMYLAHIGR